MTEPQSVAEAREWLAAHTGEGAAIDALIAAVRADEREVQGARDEALEEALRVIASIECHCDEAYTARGRHESNAFHSDFEDELNVIKAHVANAAAPTQETP